LPGDVALTRLIQDVFGPNPVWAEQLTNAGRQPWAVVAVAVAAGMAYSARGWRGAAAAVAAYCAALLADAALRMMIMAPRPDPSLVAVAAPSASSGLPSTFGLVFGALGGTVIAAAWRRPGWSRPALILIAGAAMTAGTIARVTLGGHWPSQMVLSLAAGAVLAAALVQLAGQRPAA
jgi:hypothetical protein